MHNTIVRTSSRALARDPRTVNLMNKKSKIIIITGQTSTGKTALALEYARKHDGEIINCDSRQIYKYLDIITGKDVEKVLKKQNFIVQKNREQKFDIGYYTLQTKNYKLPTKIWLYDIVKPDQYFSSFDYQQCALWVIRKILFEGRTPIIVGGTYLYIKHLLYEIETEHIAPDWKLRKELAGQSIQELQTTLKLLNPKMFQFLNNSEKNNPQRLIRRIEIIKYKLSNQHIQPPELNLLSKQSETEKKIILPLKLPLKLDIKNFEIDIIGLKFKNKEGLIKAIETRVEKRLKDGAVYEVKELLKKGYAENNPGLKTIGYQQLLFHLRGGIDFNTAVQTWITKEVQYAKRQYTFMKKDRNIQWKEI